MAEPFSVKASPGKGLGVFSTRDIGAGEVIMRDTAKMKIYRPTGDVTSEQLRLAFDVLSAEDQVAFMDLYPGIIPYDTQLKRIFKTNSFGDQGSAYIALKISRINHDCTPNAESDSPEDDMVILAIKPIAKGEEVFISYNGYLEEGSKKERRQLLWETNGFLCHCTTCTLKGVEAALSDGRRQIINVLTHKLCGFEPVVSPKVEGGKPERKHNIIGKHEEELKVPLPKSEIAAYGFLLAKLQEVRGLCGIGIVKAYVWAAEGLFAQLFDYNGVVFLQSACYVAQWMVKALHYAKKVRGNASDEVAEVEGLYKEMLAAAELELALRFIHDKNNVQKYTSHDVSTIFAIDCEDRGRFMTQSQCQKFLSTGTHDDVPGEYLNDVNERKNAKHRKAPHRKKLAMR